MKSLVIKIAGKVRTLFTPSIVKYENKILPARHLRFCGEKFKEDKYFLETSRKEAKRLIKHFGLNVNCCLLDVGCGVGRLPIGILDTVGEIREYCGIDVNKKSMISIKNL